MKLTKSSFDKLSIIGAALLLAACSSQPELEADAVQPILPLPAKPVGETIGFGYVSNDPWEGFNRRMYYFNARVDHYVLLPLVSGYQYVTPDLVEQGVTHFFSNVGEVNTMLNSLLQLKGKRALTSASRLVVNSTLGMLGLFDPATGIGLHKEKEDFGQTLGYWGVANGPYVVLPFFGPSTIRDTAGLGVDTLTHAELVNLTDLNWETKMGMDVLQTIDTRKNIPFRYYGSGSAFDYELTRFMYLRARQLLVSY